jgi:hypothetical protein
MTVTRTSPRLPGPATTPTSITAKETCTPDCCELLEEIQQLLAAMSVYRKLVDRLLAERTSGLGKRPKSASFGASRCSL